MRNAEMEGGRGEGEERGSGGSRKWMEQQRVEGQRENREPTVAEDGEVVVIVELLDVDLRSSKPREWARARRLQRGKAGGRLRCGSGADLPLDLVADAIVLDRDGQVPALVEAAEFGVWGVGADCDGAALWDLDGLGGGEGLGERVAGATRRIGVSCLAGRSCRRARSGVAAITQKLSPFM